MFSGYLDCWNNTWETWRNWNCNVVLLIFLRLLASHYDFNFISALQTKQNILTPIYSHSHSYRTIQLIQSCDFFMNSLRDAHQIFRVTNNFSFALVSLSRFHVDASTHQTFEYIRHSFHRDILQLSPYEKSWNIQK